MMSVNIRNRQTVRNACFFLERSNLTDLDIRATLNFRLSRKNQLRKAKMSHKSILVTGDGNEKNVEEFGLMITMVGVLSCECMCELETALSMTMIHTFELVFVIVDQDSQIDHVVQFYRRLHSNERTKELEVVIVSHDKVATIFQLMTKIIGEQRPKVIKAPSDFNELRQTLHDEGISLVRV